ncbi:universal stress protein [Herbaspirillum sp. RV1423]|uniref:universal stress protein n=1 Tax=Herbaspirillum sp. RV1423 TaxID=1443993 RepID=UPI0004B0CF3A|nr:universal stress protein [Herbaspirillum sp. RV1423]
MFKTILLATDGSELSRKTIAATVDFAASYGSKIVGLCVAEVFSNLVTPVLITYDLNALEEEVYKQSVQNVNVIAEYAKKAGVPCEVHTVKGTHPYEEILKCATQFHCDAIVMASYGRKGLDKLLLGSETQKVLAHSTIPVLVFK